MQKNIDAVEKVVDRLMAGDSNSAKQVIDSEYPFKVTARDTRSYTVGQKMMQFKKDGFIDRYTGSRLVNPGILKVISHYLPESFPYQKNWKMMECHVGYWELTPTIDHVYPIARGGEESPDNWVTTSMLNNSVKSNWTLEQLRWRIIPAGDFLEWDGLTEKFISLVEADSGLMDDAYIKNWYRASKKILG